MPQLQNLVKTVTREIWQGDDTDLLGLCKYLNSSNQLIIITQAVVQTIDYVLSAEDVADVLGTFDKTEVIFDVPLTGDVWPYTGGANFKAHMAGSNFTLAPKEYQLDVKITLVGGALVKGQWTIKTLVHKA